MKRMMILTVLAGLLLLAGGCAMKQATPAAVAPTPAAAEPASPSPPPAPAPPAAAASGMVEERIGEAPRTPAPAPVSPAPVAAAPNALPTAAAPPPAGATDAPVAAALDQKALEAAAAAAGRELVRIHFDYDQYTLTGEARDILNANAALLKTRPGVKVLLEGHCDERGSDQYNIALGERRAQATRDYLMTLGVDGERLATVSYGEEKPLVAESNEAAWAQNRRVEFVPGS